MGVAYCKVYRMCHWSNRSLNQTSRSSFMVDIICVLWNDKLSNLYRNLVLLNRLLHGFAILIPSAAVGCFSKQSFVTPQVNQREEKEANITSKLFIPHQGNCWNYAAPMLSSLQAVRPCSKFSMISLPYWEYVQLAVVICLCKTTHLHFDCLTVSFSLIWREFSVHKNIIIP